MTGFGDAAIQRHGVHYAIEVRSVNNRYFKAAIRLPEDLLAMEPMLEAHLRKRVARGTVTVNVSLKDTSAAAAHSINTEALRRYLQHLEVVEQEAASSQGLPRQVTIDLAGLLSLPGIVQPPLQSELMEVAGPIIRELLDQACDKMLAMRETEGEGTVDDLIEQKRFIEDLLSKVAARAPFVIEEYHEHLRQRVEKLLSRSQIRLEQADLAREVAVFAERCDIGEEVQRLRSHLAQLEQILTESNEDPVGRKLDFLAQELLREANTIASKSNDAEIAILIVAIKGAIDRIKEQVQNIE